MKHPCVEFRAAAVAVAAAMALLCSSGALSQVPADWPSKPIIVTSPYDAGGIQGRLLPLYFRSIQAATGKQFVMNYRPGAGTTIGTTYVVRSAPDGYNLLGASPATTIIPSVYEDLGFDPVRDLAPVSLLSKEGYVLVVTAGAPYKTLQEYIAYARANPGKLNWGTSGAGSPSHLPGEYLHSLTKSKVTFVHYKTGAQRYTDLASGRIEVSMGSFNSFGALIKAGKVVPIGVTTIRRIVTAPDVPTFDEQGIKDYDFSGWMGLSTAAKTPPAIIERLNSWFVAATRDPDIRKLEADGTMVLGTTAAEFGQMVRMETEIWRKVIKEGGLKIAPE